jgi:2-polyprenyl-3-methyl-5-hydroxy-6-metoxy-1,4-benzoquinol methylase
MVEIKDGNEIRTYSCPKCYLCGNEGKLLYESLKDRLFGAPGEWNLKKCTNPECGLVWLDPMPVEEDIGKAYQNYYTHNDKPQHDKYLQTTSFIRLLLQIVYRTVTTIPSYILGIKAEQFQLSRMYLNKVKPCRLLEIGCGSSEFLSHMQIAGWEVEGIDFDAKAVENLREKYGINIHLGSLESVQYPDNSFDAIAMNHVIEHIPNPVALLQECYRILKPGGYLVAVTPNINSWGHQKFGANWRGLETPRHIHIFSQTTLRESANKSGFKKIETWTVASRSLSIFNGSFDIQKFGYHSMNKPDNQLHILKSLIFCYTEYILLKILKINHELGEEVVLFAQKN